MIGSCDSEGVSSCECPCLPEGGGCDQDDPVRNKASMKTSTTQPHTYTLMVIVADYSCPRTHVPCHPSDVEGSPETSLSKELELPSSTYWLSS